jgi:hypothetical protein
MAIGSRHMPGVSRVVSSPSPLTAGNQRKRAVFSFFAVQIRSHETLLFE